MKVIVVIPCHNESKTIEEIVPVVRSAGDGVRAIYAILNYNLFRGRTR